MFRGLQHNLMRNACRFKDDARGGVAIIAALSVLPLVVVMGAASDLAHANKRRAELQNAADATALSSAKQARALSTSALASYAQQQFGALLQQDGTATMDAPVVASDLTQVCITARESLPTAMMKVIGVQYMPISATGCAKVISKFYEIALVLDNSGSMLNSAGGQTKLQALQVAAKSLVDTMNPAGQATPQAAFSVVPFTAAVNVGPAFKSAAFMDSLGKSSIHWQNFQRPASASWLPTSRFDLYTVTSATWAGCVEERPAPYLTTDTAASSVTPDTLFVPTLYPDESDSSSYTPFNNYLSDTGGSCATKDAYWHADQPGDALNTGSLGTGDGQTKLCKYKNQTSASTYSANMASNRGPNAMCTTKPLLTLNTDANSVRAMIANNLVAQGDTNLLAGLMWGWRTISPNGPFGNQGAGASVGPQNPYAYNAITPDNRPVVKVIVFMTDGKNNWAASSSDPNGAVYNAFGFMKNKRLGSTTTAANSRTLMDTKTLEACTNAKAAGIQLFTVGFSTPTDPIDSQGLNVLQSCASSASMAMTASDSTAIVKVFQDIAKQITQIRLSQ